MQHKELLTDKTTQGDRMYSFEVHRSESGELYMLISEDKECSDSKSKNTLLISENDIDGFKGAFNRLVKKFMKISNSSKEKKTYNLEEIRQHYPQAYRSWSVEDDEKLEALFCEGKTSKQLAAIFERKVGAINSRINKLELRLKYP